MITHRPAASRGILEMERITSRRTFSNNSYQSNQYLNYSDLEVINDDILQPGFFVPEHRHANMEILGYVVDGPCEHADSHGNKYSVPSGTVQFMSTGVGIKHTEGNASDKPIRYLQLWIKPNQLNTQPKWQYRAFSREDKLNKFCPIAGNRGGMPIKQNAQVYAGIFTEDFTHPLSDRKYYVYIVTGSATINGIEASEGDGFAIEDETELSITKPDAEILLFDLRK